MKPIYILIASGSIVVSLLAGDPNSTNKNRSYSIRIATDTDTAPRCYLGTIVNGNCSPAGALSHVDLSTTHRKKNILRYCTTNASTSAFALLTDGGELWKLDETGNQDVISRWDSTSSTILDDKGKIVRHVMRAAITGRIEGETLRVQSLSRLDASPNFKTSDPAGEGAQSDLADVPSCSVSMLKKR